MPINFLRSSGLHPYETDEKAAEFLAYLYQLTQISDPTLAIACQSRKVITVRQLLQYGKRALAKHAQAGGLDLFAPFAVLASRVMISARHEGDPDNVLRLAKQQYFNECLLTMQETFLFALFRDIDLWIKTANMKPFIRRFNPKCPDLYLIAIEKFIALRGPAISDKSVSASTLILHKL